jgi:glycosyltransferase involved in cell wall biosynthesis
MTRILHVMRSLSRAGSSRSLVAIAKGLEPHSPYEHTLISLLPVAQDSRPLARRAGIAVIEVPDAGRIRDEIAAADIVQVEWWNNPEIEAILRSDWPPARLLVYSHVAGDEAPFVVTRELLQFADVYVAGCGYAHRIPAVLALPPENRAATTAIVTATADFDRLAGLRRRPHATFNVGYIGKADFKKMHPNYIAMSARVRVPSARFLVCGNGHLDLLARQADALGAADRFEFRGYVEDIRAVLEELDVYGYPLGIDVGAELNLQEAMYAGVPPVVFPRGGIADAVTHGVTGLVVDSESAYSEAIEYLYHHPAERARLGDAARRFALEHFDGRSSAARLHGVYRSLLQRPKQPRRWPAAGDGLTHPSGARRFAESLGEYGAPFLADLAGGDRRSRLEAERSIAASSLMTLQVLSDYAGAYPEDHYLRHWSGLIPDVWARYAPDRQHPDRTAGHGPGTSARAFAK